MSTTRLKNVEEAKALLAEAGYPNGEGFPLFSIKYTPSTELENVARRWPRCGSSIWVSTAKWPPLRAAYTGQINRYACVRRFRYRLHGLYAGLSRPSAAFTVLENAEGKAKTRWDCPTYLELCSDAQ